jgi:hypothetical protein
MISFACILCRVLNSFKVFLFLFSHHIPRAYILSYLSLLSPSCCFYTQPLIDSVMYSSNDGVENGGCDDISLEAMFPTESMTGLHHLRNICSALNHLDRSVAKIMDHLKSAHQWEDTIFIFTSTNGRSVSSSISSAGYIGSMQTKKVNDDEYVCLNTQIYCYHDSRTENGHNNLIFATELFLTLACFSLSPPPSPLPCDGNQVDESQVRVPAFFSGGYISTGAAVHNCHQEGYRSLFHISDVYHSILDAAATPPRSKSSHHRVKNESLLLLREGTKLIQKGVNQWPYLTELATAKGCDETSGIIINRSDRSISPRSTIIHKMEYLEHTQGYAYSGVTQQGAHKILFEPRRPLEVTEEVV